MKEPNTSLLNDHQVLSAGSSQGSYFRPLRWSLADRSNARLPSVSLLTTSDLRANANRAASTGTHRLATLLADEDRDAASGERSGPTVRRSGGTKEGDRLTTLLTDEDWDHRIRVQSPKDESPTTYGVSVTLWIGAALAEKNGKDSGCGKTLKVKPGRAELL
ncbi:hypothetical protein H0H81_009519 [Sphagnurus paluster]|uniref:Uncharacterized protein n=1 Tax=Sphagnurus paluster TaxID=117069 RepID=A0A9P7FTI9_9AGAR|nr:hypothetical protein H0H81_009519 [Sphagnurus paluster]